MIAQKRHIRILIICLLTAIALLLGGCSSGLSQSSGPPGSQALAASGSEGQDLRVHFIDVGQGDSILVQSDGHFMLIDAGENNQADTVIRYLQQAGVTELDYVIGTHPHSDHIGGLDKVIGQFTVKKVILPPVEHTSRTFEDLLDSISNKGLKITKPVPGTSYSLGAAAFTIVAPAADYGNDLNNWSVGIRLTYGDNSFLMCGDAEKDAEEDMVNSGAVLSADVLKAGHHGSNTSTSDAFFKKVSPSYVVIQCGRDNSYGHPHKETMEKLEQAGCRIFRTDKQGTIIADSDGSKITWTTISGQIGTEQTGTGQTGTGQTGAGQTGTGQTYILNTNTKKFHVPECSSVSQIRDGNRREVTSTRDELTEAGYAPCKQCNP